MRPVKLPDYGSRVSRFYRMMTCSDPIAHPLRTIWFLDMVFRRFRRMLSRQNGSACDAMADSRETMVREHLRGRDITSAEVLRAMATVPREKFVDETLRHEAYADRALPIGQGQTISQPYMVALMTQLLDVKPDHRVLEIGTGSGYQTAILAELAKEVVSVERHAELSQQAEKCVAECGYENVIFSVGDGSLGWPELAPYDRILITAAAEHVPPPLVDQLAIGGILVGPFGDRDNQQLQLWRKRSDQTDQQLSIACRFVPLIGEEGFAAE